MKKSADFPLTVIKCLVLKKQVENRNPYIPKHLRFRQRPIEDKGRLERQWKRWRWKPQEWHEKYMFFRVEERTTVFFQGLSLTANSDSFVSDGRCRTRNF